MTDDSGRLTTSDIAAADQIAPGDRSVPVNDDEDEGRHAALFVNEDAAAYRARWSGVQAGSLTSRVTPSRKPTRSLPKS